MIDIGQPTADLKTVLEDNARLRAKLTQIQEKLETIVEPEGIDAGVILLSTESPTHGEMGSGGTVHQVYDHEYFSELGDALVELWKMLKEEDDASLAVLAREQVRTGNYQTTEQYLSEIKRMKEIQRCPRCGSSDPKLHPAVQYEGEVQICPHEFHNKEVESSTSK